MSFWNVLSLWCCMGKTFMYGLLYLSGLFLTTNAMAQPKIFSTSNDIGGVEIFDTGNIPASVATALHNNSLTRIVPYTIVVHNTGRLPITGLDVRYEITTNGTEVVKNFFYGSPGDLSNPASFPIIAPDKSTVVSPIHEVNEQLMSSGTLSLLNKDIPKIRSMADLFDKADEVKISVDSIIRSDGVIVGPDRSSRFRLFQQQISGYTTFRNELLRRFAEGESDADIISWLKQTKSLKVIRRGPNEPLDRGIMLQKTLATEYLELMEEGQRQHCLDKIKAARPEQMLQQIFKVRQEATL